MSEKELVPEQKPEPLFILNLGANGGILAPTSVAELQDWLDIEINFWSWAAKDNGIGNLDQPESNLLNAIRLLYDAREHAANEEERQNPLRQLMRQYETQRPQNYIENCHKLIKNVYLGITLPHSTTQIGWRINNFKNRAGNAAARMFASVYVQNKNGGTEFLGHSADIWRGLFEGFIDRYDMLDSIAGERRQTAEAAFEQLRQKADQFFNLKSLACDDLHREYAKLADSIRHESDVQAEAHKAREIDYEKLTVTHEQKLEALRRAFKTEIGMREPVEYWKTKRDVHQKWSKGWGGMSILGIAGAASSLSWLIHDLLNKTPANTAPETWRLAVLALVAVFTVWGVRLIVRLFLSHQHLYTDAQERITMVQTYLSLMEGEHLASRNDRQLILQALFRPASDGLVKDEGVPFSLAEVITRQGKP